VTPRASASFAEFPILGSARPASQIRTELCDVPEASAKPCRLMPDSWFKYKNKHSHVALEDAIEQGWMFVEMLKDSR
jgi:hypothetical protein